MSASTQTDNPIQQLQKQSYKTFSKVAFFSVFVNMLLLVPSIYMLQVYDRVLISRSVPTLISLTLIVAILLIGMGALEWVRSGIMQRFSLKVEAQLSMAVFRSMFKRALKGDGASSMQAWKDLSVIRQFLAAPSILAFFDVPFSPLYLVLLYLFHPVLGVIATLGTGVLVVLTLLNDYASKKRILESNSLSAKSQYFLQTHLPNADSISAMGMRQTVERRWKQCLEPNRNAQLAIGDVNNTFKSIAKGVRFLLQSLILGAGAYLAIHQVITPGLIIASSILLGRLMAPIDQILGAWRMLISAKQSLDNLKQTLTSDSVKAMPLPPLQGMVDVQKVIVVPPQSKKAVISGVNFTIQAGEAVAIIGPSGSGKSSLLKAILGLWPLYGGCVRFDGADMANADWEEVGQYVGYLPQNCELFVGTIAENIARLKDIDSNAVIEAAKLANAHQMILALPQGYDTQVGANSCLLSAGQRQRIGLARALYGNPRLVVLDEPNSNLDDQGDAALYSCLTKLKLVQVTVIVVSHRGNILKIMDKILLLKSGKMQIYGEASEVVAKIHAAKLSKAHVETV